MDFPTPPGKRRFDSKRARSTSPQPIAVVFAGIRAVIGEVLDKEVKCDFPSGKRAGASMSASETQLDELIAAAKAGDDDALGVLLERYRPYLRILAEQAIGPALGQRYDASDVIQQTCIEAVNDFARFEGISEGQLSAWLRQILRRNVSNLVRDNRAAKRDVRKELALYQEGHTTTIVWLEPQADSRSPSEKVMHGETVLRLAAALETLPEDQRTAVRLRFLEGRQLAEIADELERTVSSVAGLIHRGVRALEGKMGDI